MISKQPPATVVGLRLVSTQTLVSWVVAAVDEIGREYPVGTPIQITPHSIGAAQEELQRLSAQYHLPVIPPDTCLDCGVATELLVLQHELWRSITEETRGVGQLCIDCMEQRLGRRLRLQDVDAAVPCNRAVLRLLERLESLTAKNP